MSEQKLALIDGTYPSLMAGGVVATRLTSQNLDDYYGADYWGKTYYAIGGNTVTGKPTNVSGFYLQVCQAGGGTTIQLLSNLNATDASAAPTLWQRGYDGNKSTWSDWEEIVTSGGNYPNMGAGYLAKRRRLQTDGVQQGWLKIGTVPFSSMLTYQCYSCIMIINGVFRGSAAAATAPKSGIIEIEGRKYSTTLGDVRIGVLAGDVSKNDLCWVKEDNLNVSIYIYNNYTENICITFEILSEEESDKTPANIFVWSDDITALTSAPTGAVYAIVRNNASYAESIPTASQTQLGGAYIFKDSDGYLNINTEE